MTKLVDEKISENRLLLQNPYAFLNGDGLYDAVPINTDFTGSLKEKITKSRRLLQDPYAYLNDSGGFSAAQRHLPLSKKVEKKYRYSDKEIEQRTKDLQKNIWQKRNEIWSIDSAPTDPIDMLDPAVAFGLIGYDFDTDETLGQYSYGGKQIEVAGIIDSNSKLVRISRRFPNNTRNFTAAHELGHALLHDARGLHRDRPLDGSSISRDSTEFEADKFATYFLMPRKLVNTRFKRFFLTDNFSLNEDTSFALTRDNSITIGKSQNTIRDLSRILSSTESYNGVRFISLANQFRVSVEAMAIRLEELELLSV